MCFHKEGEGGVFTNSGYGHSGQSGQSGQGSRGNWPYPIIYSTVTYYIQYIAIQYPIIYSTVTYYVQYITVKYPIMYSTLQ